MFEKVSLEQELVIGVLLTDHDQMSGGAVRSLHKYGFRERVTVDIAFQPEQALLLSAQELQARHKGSHIVFVHYDAYLSSSFLDDVLTQIQYFFDKGVDWGAFGNSGISFPYFKPICNILIAGNEAERFACVLPAAHLDPYLLVVHKDVSLASPANLAPFPADAPVNDAVGLAAWEAGKPCWICNIPFYVEAAAPSHNAEFRDEWRNYIAAHYNNASFVSSFGMLEIKGSADIAKDYYYAQMEPVLHKATRDYDTVKLSVFLFATFYDADILDRCLMSVVSQFQRPYKLYIIGLDAVEEQRRREVADIIEAYRHYIEIQWAGIESGQAAETQFLQYIADAPQDGYSLCLYDTSVLFPQAVRQVCEFFQFCLGDKRVLPITNAEISRLHRSVDAHIPSQPRAFFREIEKIGFSHEETWRTAQPSATIHFTFPNAFLSGLRASELDAYDLGSVLPQRLFEERLSFFLIERGSGYTSFQKASPNETVSPLTEGESPFHLANKARALLAGRSNLTRYSVVDNQIVPVLAYQGSAADLRRQQVERARLAELDDCYRKAEHEIAKLQQFIEQQEIMLRNYRKSWYFKVRRTALKLSRPIRSYLKK